MLCTFDIELIEGCDNVIDEDCTSTFDADQDQIFNATESVINGGNFQSDGGWQAVFIPTIGYELSAIEASITRSAGFENSPMTVNIFQGQGLTGTLVASIDIPSYNGGEIRVDDLNIVLGNDYYSFQFDAPGTNSNNYIWNSACLLYTSPSPRDRTRSRMPSSA